MQKRGSSLFARCLLGSGKGICEAVNYGLGIGIGQGVRILKLPHPAGEAKTHVVRDGR